MKKSKLATIGVDIGGTKILFALFDAKFRVVKEIKIKTHAERGARYFAKRLGEAIDELRAEAKKKRMSVVAAGAGCAGWINHEDGTVEQCLNIPFLAGFPLRDRLSKLTGVHTVLANDVQAGLYGEHRLGAAAGRKNVIGIFVGTGVGGALVVNDRLYVGTDGFAGNVGNYLLHTVGSAAGWNREGTLDDIVSRTAIAGEAAVLATKQWAPNLYRDVGTDVARIRSEDLAWAIRRGDEHIEKLVRSRARILGIALSNFVDFLNPDMIVLGGGLVDAMPALIRKEVEAGIVETVSMEAAKSLQVVVTKLKNHSVTIGAAKMALDKSNSERLPA